MASLGDGVEVYTSDGPCGAASTQYRGLVMVSKVKSRNAFSDIRCVVYTSADREVRGKRCLFVLSLQIQLFEYLNFGDLMLILDLFHILQVWFQEPGWRGD